MLHKFGNQNLVLSFSDFYVNPHFSSGGWLLGQCSSKHYRRVKKTISCFLHYKRYRSSQSDENHLLALCKLFSQLIQIKSFPLQSISSPDANYFLLCKLPCHPPWKLSSHPLQIIFSPGETILGFNEPDHDEHPLTPGLATSLSSRSSIVICCRKGCRRVAASARKISR